jgi:DNA-binding transcriptional LysR family regulator
MQELVDQLSAHRTPRPSAASTSDFTPATTTREFSMVVSDYSMAVLGPGVVELLAAEAPAARVRFIDNPPQVIDSVRQTLTNIDGVVLPRGFVTDMPHHDLYHDEWVCLVSAGNREVGDTLTVRQLQTLPWVITYRGHPPTSTLAARRMRVLGIDPRVQVVTETFLGVPGLVSGSNRVALLPRRLTERIPAELGVRALPSPFDVGTLVEVLSWHPMYDEDPEHRYFRDLVVRAAGEITAAGS